MAAYPPSGFFDVGTFAEAFDRVGQAAREASYSLRDGLAESFREVGRAMSGLTSFLEGRRSCNEEEKGRRDKRGRRKGCQNA